MSEAGAGGIVALVKDVWQAFVMPAGLAAFGLAKWLATLRDKRDTDRRSEQQKRDDAFAAKFERLDGQMKAHVEWLASERAAAAARADRAEEALDALRDKARAELDAQRAAAEAALQRMRDDRWKLELRVVEHEHDIRNLRQLVDDTERRLNLPPRVWRPLERQAPTGEG